MFGEELLTLGFQVLDYVLLVRVLDGRKYGRPDEQVQQIEHAEAKQTPSVLADLEAHGVCSSGPVVVDTKTHLKEGNEMI